MQPVLTALFATIAGLSLAPYYSLPLFPASLIATFSAVLFLRWHHVRMWAFVFLFLFVFVISNLRYPLQFPPRQDIIQIDHLTKKVTITGRVTDVRSLTDGRRWFEMIATDVTRKKQVLQLDSPFKVRLYLGEGNGPLYPGDIVRCNSRLRKPRLFGTPGEFHWPRYLRSQGTDMTGWVKSFDQLTVLESHESFPFRTLAQWRSRVADNIVGLLPEERANLVRALILGEGRIIPDSTRKVLGAGGISHLFAISGLHLGMIALLGYRLLLSCYLRCPRLLRWQPPQRILPLVLLPLLLVYLLLTGDAVSTRRAFTLAALGAVFIVWRYHINPLLLLASLAMISLQINPLLLWQAGWQLSFAGASGILLWRPLWQKVGASYPFYLRYFVQLFLVTFAAMLATLPLVLLNFHLLAPAGVVANLICVPVVTLLALPIGFVGLLLFFIVPSVAELLFQICGFLLDFLLYFVKWIILFPGLGATHQFLSVGQSLAVALSVISLLCIVQWPNHNRFKVMIFCFVSACILWQFPLSQKLPVTLTMLSVGQGESMLLQNNYQQTILIDGGGFYSDRFDVGERLLAPAFGQLGITELDAVFLTHDDLDHRKGLVFILKHFLVREFWVGQPLADLHDSLREVLVEKNIKIKVVPSGWSDVSFWNQGRLKVFNGRTPSSSNNDGSLVLHLNHADYPNLLLTGDLERQGVLTLLSAGLPGSVSLLKLPHHGSKFSITDSLIDQLEPDLCLVSAGYKNRYHFPAKKVVDYIQKRNIPLYRTDLSGTIQAAIIDGTWQVRHWKGGLFR